MADGKRTVEVVIKAKDVASKAIGQFRRRLRVLTNAFKDVTRGAVAFTAAAAGMVFGLTKLSQEGAKVVGVKRTFARITRDEVAALRELRKAADGTISDMQLMAFHNQAIALGAAETTEQFARMVDVSKALGRAQGIDALKALESLTTGVGRQSRQFLDNLGIIVDADEANQRYADTLKRQASTLTESERKIAFRNEALRQAEELVGRLTGEELAGAEAADRFATMMGNVRDRLSEVVAESPLVATFFEELTGLMGDLVEIIGGDASDLVDGMKILGRMAGNAFVVGVNEAFAALPENTAFDRFFLKLLPPRAREFLEGLNLQQRFFGSGAAEGRANLATARQELEVLAGRTAGRRGRRGGGGRGAGGGVGGGGGGGGGAFPGVPGFGPIPGFAGVEAAQNLQSARSRGRGAPITPFEDLHLSPRGAASFLAAEEERRRLEQASEGMKRARDVTVASMFGMAEAAIRGGQQVEVSVVNMITGILQSVSGGGILGTIIGGVGGLIGAAFARSRRDPVPVRLDDLSSTAAQKMRDASGGPTRITTIIEQGGVEVERIEKELRDRTARDEVVRFGTGGSVGMGS